MQQAILPAHEAAILSRLAGKSVPAFSRATAEGFLALAFGEVDKNRMEILAAKARTGTLTPNEQSEVEAYSRISSLLGILKSKARRALKRRPANGKAKVI